MELSNIAIEQILALPERAATFAMSRRLGAMFPGQAVRTIKYFGFNLDYFLRYSGHQAELLPSLWCEEVTTCENLGDPPRIRTGILRIEWNGLTFHLATMPQCERGSVHFLVGPDDATINRFIDTVVDSQSLALGDVLVFANGNWDRDEELIKQLETARFDDLVLSKRRLLELRRHVLGFFDSRQAYDDARISWRRGILMTGPPGNGKTTAIRSICGAIQVPRLIARNFAGPYGDSGGGVDDVFERASQMAPCLLVIEDIDSTIRKNYLSSVLNHLDGLLPMRGVMVLATTNHPERLDPAIRMRPSRFDRVLEFPAPNAPLRKRFLRRELDSLGVLGHITDEEIADVARATAGFSFAFLKELVVSAVMLGVGTRRKSTLHDRLIDVAKSLQEQFRRIPPPIEGPPDNDENEDD